jgi:hypothetical protein
MCGEQIVRGETFQLTDEEMAILGPNGQRELHYCSSCLKASRNLEQGSSILAGFFERMLRASGIPGAKQAAEKFKERLLVAARRKLQ